MAAGLGRAGSQGHGRLDHRVDRLDAEATVELGRHAGAAAPVHLDPIIGLLT